MSYDIFGFITELSNEKFYLQEQVLYRNALYRALLLEGHDVLAVFSRPMEAYTGISQVRMKRIQKKTLVFWSEVRNETIYGHVGKSQL